MKDGFYLSTYLHIDEYDAYMNIKIRHDQSIALWKKESEEIELVHYWELERKTGTKMHPISFYNKDHAMRTIEVLLKEENITLDDIQGMWGTPEIDTIYDYASDELNNLAYHSVCHLYSSLLSDADVFYNNNIIGLAVDGGPDAVVDEEVLHKKFYAGCVSKNGKIEHFSINSPAQMWFYAFKKTGMREGTLMALASASKSVSYEKKWKIEKIDSFDDFIYAESLVDNIFNDVFNYSEEDVGVKFNGFDDKFSKYENQVSMAMKIINELSLQMMEKTIDNIINKYNLSPKDTYLALSGGFTLNCPTNSSLLSKYQFKGFLSTPCVSDSGMALGIGLYGFYKKMNGQISFKLKNAFYGDKENDIENLCSQYIEYIEKIEEMSIEQVAKDIIDDVVVWFDGAAEIGPRSLGHRALLANPMKEYAKDRLNEIKRREWWRPVAPIVLEEDIKEWFKDSSESPYMLRTFEVVDDKRQFVPAILHLDNSARVQSINETDLSLYRVILKFKEITGVPIICNTSLNDKGEPIINSGKQALNFALRKKINIVYYNGKRIKLKNFDKYFENLPYKRELADAFEYEVTEEMCKQMNPYNVSRPLLTYYRKTPFIKRKFDIRKEIDVRRLRAYAKLVLKMNDL